MTREAGGKQRHRGEEVGRKERGHVKTSVSGYATSGLVHIGHRREGGGVGCGWRGG